MLSHEGFASFGPNQRPKKIIQRSVFQPSHIWPTSENLNHSLARCVFASSILDWSKLDHVLTTSELLQRLEVHWDHLFIWYHWSVGQVAALSSQIRCGICKRASSRLPDIQKCIQNWPCLNSSARSRVSTHDQQECNQGSTPPLCRNPSTFSYFWCDLQFKITWTQAPLRVSLSPRSPAHINVWENINIGGCVMLQSFHVHMSLG